MCHSVDKDPATSVVGFFMMNTISSLFSYFSAAFSLFIFLSVLAGLLYLFLRGRISYFSISYGLSFIATNFMMLIWMPSEKNRWM